MSIETKVAANSIQIMCQVEGVMDPSGRVKRNLILRTGKFHLHLDAEAFPFLTTSDPAMVILSVVQVRPVKVEDPPMFATKLILPPGGPATPLPTPDPE